MTATTIPTQAPTRPTSARGVTGKADNQRQPASPKDAHHPRARLCYSYPKPKGPMCDDIVGSVVAAPTVKRGFVASEFVRHGIPMSAWLGADGPYREAGRTAEPVSSTSAHPLRVMAWRVDFCLVPEPNP